MIDYGSSQSKQQYTRRIGDNGFLGADFSTAPIFASPRRFRDLKNVWKDYKSGSGVEIETVPGYRQVSPFTSFDADNYQTTINNIFRFNVVSSDTDFAFIDDGEWIGIHRGKELHFFREDHPSDYNGIGKTFRYVGEGNYKTVDVGGDEPIYVRYREGTFAVLPDAPSIAVQHGNTIIIFCDGEAYTIRRSKDEDQEASFYLNGLYGTTELECGFFAEPINAYVPTTYIDGKPYEQKNMLSLRSKERFTVDVEKDVTDIWFIDATIYPHEKIIADSSPSNIEIIKVNGIDITDNGSYTVNQDTQGYVEKINVIFSFGDFDPGSTATVEIEYTSAPTAFTSYQSFEDYKDRRTFNEGNPGYTGTAYDAIAGCTICASFDERIFLAGNPKLPNTIIYSQRDLTGYNNPTYFGVLNYNNLGTSNTPITAMIPSANTLYVLKDDSATDPTMYVLTGQTTEIDLLPRIYTVESGLPGIGCKGAACNFLDDIVFMSKNGVIGIDKQAVNLERTLGDRSVLINGRLTREDPTKAIFAEWEGYLAVLFTNNGHLYLADSRAYTQGAGYEWYFVDSVGSWENDADDYEYSDEYVNQHGSVVDGTLQADAVTFDGGSGYKYETEIAFGTDSPNLSSFVVEHKSNGNVLLYSKSSGTTYKVVARGTENEHYTSNGQISVYFDYTGTEGDYSSTHERYAMTYAKNLTSENKIILVETSSGSGEYYQVKPTGEKVCTNSTVFHPATCMVALNDRILFGTADGKVLTFNTDKRGVPAASEECADLENNPGSKNRYPNLIRPKWYNFCGHRIESYVETEDDDAGVANATKDTVKRSVVVDLKALLGSRYKVTTYTDRDGWKNDNVATGAINDLSNIGFGSINFKGDDHVYAQIRERARKWIHKRYKVESNGFNAPFGIYRITYSFEIAGRVK